MPELIEDPSRVEAAGTKPKVIEEFVGHVNTGEAAAVERARARDSPEGRRRARPAPDVRRVDARARRDAARRARERRVRRPRRPGDPRARRRVGALLDARTPAAPQYVAVCAAPALSPDTVNRDDDAPHERGRAAGERREDARRGRRRRRDRHASRTTTSSSRRARPGMLPEADIEPVDGPARRSTTCPRATDARRARPGGRDQAQRRPRHEHGHDAAPSRCSRSRTG